MALTLTGSATATLAAAGAKIGGAFGTQAEGLRQTMA
jgi:hypothetical protein